MQTKRYGVLTDALSRDCERQLLQQQQTQSCISSPHTHHLRLSVSQARSQDELYPQRQLLPFKRKQSKTRT